MRIVGFFRLQPRLVATDKELWREQKVTRRSFLASIFEMTC